jgi:MFS family permease
MIKWERLLSKEERELQNWTPPPVQIKELRFATIIAFLAWAFAVYDFILFGTLLPEIGRETGLNEASQASLATFVAIGTVIVALAAGSLVDRFGRRAGMVVTVGGAGVCSALTALAGVFGMVPLIVLRSLAGLGYAEQGVNGAYLSELYSASDDPRVKRYQGLIYSLVQGGWPVGALLAAALTVVLLPHVGWRGCFIFAAVPSLTVAVMATRLRESPQFEALQYARKQRHAGKLDLRSGATSKDSSFRDIFTGTMLRSSLALGLAHVLNWFGVQLFAVLGTTVITRVHGISFSNSLIVLLLSNIVAYVGYVCHGYLGDKLGRRNVIAAGWMLGGVAFALMLLGPSRFWVVIGLYSVGQFFLIGPYSCMLYFVGESYESRVRGTGAAFVTGIGPVGAIIASALATEGLKMSIGWRAIALFCGALPCFLSGIAVLCARSVASNRRDVPTPTPEQSVAIP